VSLRIDYDEKAIDQAAGFLRDDPAGVREVLDAIDRLADGPHPAGSFPYGSPATHAGRPLPRAVRAHRGHGGSAAYRRRARQEVPPRRFAYPRCPVYGHHWQLAPTIVLAAYPGRVSEQLLTDRERAVPEIFNSVHHVCIVVRDIAEAVGFYESIGIRPWRDYPPLEEYVELNVPDRQAFLGLTYRYTQIGSLQVQLVQPGPRDSPQRRFLDGRGEGVFHIGFAVDDVAVAEREANLAGLATLMSGRRADGSGFTYLDTAGRAGVILEVRQGGPAGPGQTGAPAGDRRKGSAPARRDC
jgi:catechol 2,3-dioxygenase-like lactoylglutathione lyase family enzyme